MSKLYILDRWEGNTAVIEVTNEADHTYWRQATRKDLPVDACEGDVLVPDGQIWRVDKQATEARRQQMAERLTRLKRRDTTLPQDKSIRQ